jgi:hypothetical protein
VLCPSGRSFDDHPGNSPPYWLIFIPGKIVLHPIYNFNIMIEVS